MNFVEAIRVIKNIIPQCSANEYDGILVKMLMYDKEVRY